jgi:hypothetical protein
MIYLDPTNDKIRIAKENFHMQMVDEIYQRIDKLRNPNAICLFDIIINEKIDHILIGSPIELIEISNLLNPIIFRDKQIKEAVNYVFNYDWFIDKKVNKYDAYKLAESLNITSCVYCNRNYTNTVISENGKKISRAQFDHYFDKGSHPILAISFFNLIPSCSTCNSSVKHTATFDISTHNHPYIDDKIDEICFSYKYNLAKPYSLEITVKAENCPKTQKNIEEFALNEVYNVHTDILSDILKTKSAFSERYLSILRLSVLKSVILSDDEMYRIVFGTEKDSGKFVNRPFSKFKKDILQELGIVKSYLP